MLTDQRPRHKYPSNATRGDLFDFVLAVYWKVGQRENSMRGLKAEVDCWVVAHKNLSTHCLRPGGSVNRLGGSRISDLVVLGVGREEQRPLDVIIFIKLQVFMFISFEYCYFTFHFQKASVISFSIIPLLCYITVTDNEYGDVFIMLPLFYFQF